MGTTYQLRWKNIPSSSGDAEILIVISKHLLVHKELLPTTWEL